MRPLGRALARSGANEEQLHHWSQQVGKRISHAIGHKDWHPKVSVKPRP
jgi:hypothetical protein